MDVVYDFAGGAVASDCLQLLADSDTLMFGALGPIAFSNRELEDTISKNQSINGFSLLPLLTLDGLRTDLTQLFKLASTGELNVLVGQIVPLNRASEAYSKLESRSSSGKIVLVP